MSEIIDSTRPRRRADAERNTASILEAAMQLLSERPDASMEEVAKAAGVTRQTIYAHYPSREALARAVRERAIAETVAALENADLGHGPPSEALDRLVAAGWQTLSRYPVLMALRAEMGPEEQRDLHRPILDRLETLIRRGQRMGTFDREQTPRWLLAAFLGLAHAAAEEVAAGRMSPAAAAHALRRSVRGVLGVSDQH